MNKRRLQRAGLLTGLVGLVLAGVFGLKLRSYRRQEALNRQLITALVKHDNQNALMLINKGADPDTRYAPAAPPSLRQFWNYVLHRLPSPTNKSPTAFLIACGAPWNDAQDTDETVQGTGAALLVAIMLRHGANVNARSKDDVSALLFAVIYADEHRNPESVAIVAQLVAHGADPDLPDKHGQSALRYAQELCPDLVALLSRGGAKK